MKYKKFSSYFFNGLLLFLVPLGLFSQCKNEDTKWIDKEESENYVARHECSFVQIGTKFILFGGRESAQKLDVYDYTSNTWNTGTSAPKEFNHFQATAYEGFVWVVAAYKTNSFPSEVPEENIWLYYPPNNCWIQGPEIPKERRRGGAGLVVYKDKFYVLGGNTNGHDGGYVDWFDEYDPTANTWTVLESASQARDHFHAAVIGNTLYAAGGRQSGGKGGVFSPLPALVDIYNFNTKSWSVLDEPLPTPRAAPGIIVYNNELLVMGGEGEVSGPAFKRVEAYNPSTKKWSRKADMNYARHGTQAILSGKGVYIAAGSPVRGGGRQRNMEVYGEDKPEGHALRPSKLKAPSELTIPVGSTKSILLKNTQGNTGIFISQAQLMGTDNEQFKTDIDINNRLIKKGNDIALKIKHIGQLTEQEATLKIIYNGNQEMMIHLKSK
ncbi:Kelch repeat-containing protein [Saccharicrinis fermentans]|uniref:Cyclically-permuted mutarotase family protein n=1 Tax=Saccharicrinis fermentans DSM 9555 = JCM 21142 TaxID=869213 RepID=W7Y483_9BACT|nr:hypothetical protein [Saccharicrinis fermentans]GAF02887.1 cyclically-permuted mutarotase family protein [Saccharicrinis fermentans DSM 9555 = JCM 21142]